MKLSELKASIEAIQQRYPNHRDLEVVISEGPRKPCLTVKYALRSVVEYHDGHLPGKIETDIAFVLLP